jgi:hypothetical protein
MPLSSADGLRLGSEGAAPFPASFAGPFPRGLSSRRAPREAWNLEEFPLSLAQHPLDGAAHRLVGEPWLVVAQEGADEASVGA